MKKFLNLFTTLFVVATLLLTACNSSKIASTTDTTSDTKKFLKHNVTLIVTSDIHAGVNDNFTLSGIYEKKKEFEEKGDYTLLIDDGDLLQGGFLSSLSKGADLIDIINEAEYDVVTFGNHEFDYGMDKFLENATKIKPEYISCNFTKNGELVFKPYVIKEFDGVKFAFIGITTPETLTTSTPKFFEDENGNMIYGFYQGNNGQNLYNQVQKTIDEVQSLGTDYVIAVAHIGEKETSKPYRYNEIISNTTGFDVFLDGHSHDTDQVSMKDKKGKTVFRMGVGTKLSHIGLVHFTTAGTIEHELLTYEKKDDGNEPKYTNKVQKIIDEKNEKISIIANEKVGYTDYPLTIFDPNETDSTGKPIRIVRRMETNLGNLVADAYKIRTGSDVAFINSGGVRVNIDKGDITVAEIKNVLPFGDTICIINASGQQILDALEWGCHVTPKESGGFPQVSGMTFTVDTSINDPCKVNDVGLCDGINGERRIKNLMINGEPVDPNKNYKLTTRYYTAYEGGDGYTAFKDCEILDIITSEDYSVVVDYIKENLNGVISDTYSNPYGDGRINIE